MQLLVLVLNKVDCMSGILAEMMAAGVRGATVLDSQGMLQLVGEASVEPPPIFGSLRKFFNPDGQMSKTLFVALREEQVPVEMCIRDRYSAEGCDPGKTRHDASHTSDPQLARQFDLTGADIN